MRVERNTACTTITIEERRPYGEPDSIAIITVPHEEEELAKLASSGAGDEIRTLGSGGEQVDVPDVGTLSIFYDDDTQNMTLSSYRGGRWVAWACLTLKTGRTVRLPVSRT